MLTGEFKHTLDTKGRVFVPAKFRADLGNSVILVKGLGNFLLMFSEPEYEVFWDKISEYAETQDDMNDFMREISTCSVPTDVDAQGRISICEDHREAIGLEKDISFVGMRKYVEIWNGERISTTKGTNLEKYRDISKKLHLGLC